MIFFMVVLGLWSRAEIPETDKKVIDYILEQEKSSQPPKNNPSIADIKIEKAGDTNTKVPQTISEMKSGRSTPDAVTTTPESILAKPWQWIVLFILLILGGVSWFLPKKKEKVGNMRIQSRSFFGQEGSLAVVEIFDAQNNPRLFLLGLHSKGAPQFLADLSAPVPFPDLFDQNMQDHKKESFTQKKTESVLQSKLTQESKPAQAPLKTDQKEALVEQVLNIRDRKVEEVNSVEASTPSKVKKQTHGDPWTEGFNEILRK